MYGDRATRSERWSLLWAVPVIGAVLAGCQPDVRSILGFANTGSFLLTLLLGLSFLWASHQLATWLAGYRFAKSVLFDRVSGQVHVFTAEPAYWRLKRYQVSSHPWSQVRAELRTMTAHADSQDKQRAVMDCVVLGAPEGADVVDCFPLGAAVGMHQVQRLVDQWEHVRRFMSRQGPALAAHDSGPDGQLGRAPLGECLMAGPRMLVSVMWDLFVIGWQEKSVVLGLAALVALGPVGLSLPLWMALGLFPWAGTRMRHRVPWPEKLLAGVGTHPLASSSRTKPLAETVAGLGSPAVSEVAAAVALESPASPKSSATEKAAPAMPASTGRTRPQQWAIAWSLLFLSLLSPLLLLTHVTTHKQPFRGPERLQAFPKAYTVQPGRPRSTLQSAAFSTGFWHGVGWPILGVCFIALGVREHGRLFRNTDPSGAEMMASMGLGLILLLAGMATFDQGWVPIVDRLREVMGGVMVDYSGLTTYRRNAGDNPYTSGRFVGVLFGMGSLVLWGALKKPARPGRRKEK